ncbi:integrase [Streptosporangium sp. NBC_01495]|uniref:hypothetical protein n=1 Tax=Streptosporangium sp. NBC_01495 TaxID=2903899 RepID=UPI002E371FC1|nr:hypothetical protein [Streptosporangium sp. NBC_01495]
MRCGNGCYARDPDVAERDAQACRLFTGINGGDLPTITYRRAWDRTRVTVLDRAEYASPLGKRIYDLRHARLSTWLDAGVPATQVAHWTGLRHSVDVLLKIYAKWMKWSSAASPTPWKANDLGRTSARIQHGQP